jgi:nitrite reductase/ring-hydroxylating ferredoxin subunit
MNAKSGNAPYSGYYNRPVQTNDLELFQVGPGTKGGEYLRRFWHPFILVSELGDTPKLVKLLGEELVLFRDQGGRLGLLHKHCSHRGTSLEFGIPAERGIRCCYHGWLYDVDGTILETPAEPATSRIAQNFCHGAYPVKELHGLIFAYMGPPELMPELPIYDSWTYPVNSEFAPVKITYPCNWAQIVENLADPIHNAYLHAIVSGQQFSPAFKVPPALDFVETPLGFLSMATRRVKDNVFIRASDLMMPNVGQVVAGANQAKDESFYLSSYLTRWVVPLDDHNSIYIGIVSLNDYTQGLYPRKKSDFGVDKMGIIGQTADRPYVDRQREPGDYDAVVTQGLIVNRANEHLGTTDRGVVAFRRLLAKGVADVASGVQPAVPRIPAQNPVRTYCHELVFKLPSQSNIAGLEAVGEFGRRAAEIVIETDTLEPQAREREAEKRIRQLLVTDLVH